MHPSRALDRKEPVSEGKTKRRLRSYFQSETASLANFLVTQQTYKIALIKELFCLSETAVSAAREITRRRLVKKRSTSNGMELKAHIRTYVVRRYVEY